jgi:tRNA(fMet)-specific endonuclease VapC
VERFSSDESLQSTRASWRRPSSPLKSKRGVGLVDAYNGFANLMVFCRKWIILPFDALAAQQFHMLKTQKVRISTMDLKIASIALAHSATLLSANLRDFRQVPDLTVEDWLS